jgi:indole-3-glycerol phosphate synthase
MAKPGDFLGAILERKRAEIARRYNHRRAIDMAPAAVGRAELAYAALRRESGGHGAVRVIAEIKRKSPSAGVIRAPVRGDAVRIAQQYVAGGAAAVSVLCDRVGFGGSVLDLRRVAAAVNVPVLFKEFVLDELQLPLAAHSGAHMVLLIVRALTPQRLHALCDGAIALGLAPVVEAADISEIEVALTTRAVIVGVNARDLRTFRVDPDAAHACLQRIPADRIAVHMSGVRSVADYRAVSAGRADAVLVGEGLMRADDPAHKLRELLGTVSPT